MLTIFIVITNIGLMPHVLKVILTNAFGLEQSVGGAIGAAVLNGVKRGLFSNEAGEGSAPNAIYGMANIGCDQSGATFQTLVAAPDSQNTEAAEVADAEVKKPKATGGGRPKKAGTRISKADTGSEVSGSARQRHPL